METALSDRLLGYLRAKLGNRVAFAEPPHRLAGGWDTATLAFRLDGAPADWPVGLILRVMARRNGLADLAEMCRKIWRVIDNRRTGRRGG